MADPTFYLKAETMLNGTVRIMEWFRAEFPGDKDHQTVLIETYVDEDIKKEYADLYKEFKKMVQANESSLFEAARADIGLPIYAQVTEAEKDVPKRKRGLISALAAFFLLISVHAEAQTVKQDLVGLGMHSELAAYIASILPGGSVLGNNTFLKARNQAGNGDLSLLKANASDHTVLNAASGKTIILSVANTPIANMGAIGVSGFAGNIPFTSGFGVKLAAAPIMTPDTAFPTPGSGSDLVAKVSIMAAGAPTAAFVQLPLATAAVGETYQVANRSSNPVAIVPISGNTQGVAAAATPFACTTLKMCDCTAVSTSNWQCGLK
jgi:hypothetical protein